MVHYVVPQEPFDPPVGYAAAAVFFATRKIGVRIRQELQQRSLLQCQRWHHLIWTWTLWPVSLPSWSWVNTCCGKRSPINAGGESQEQPSPAAIPERVEGHVQEDAIANVLIEACPSEQKQLGQEEQVTLESMKIDEALGIRWVQ